tara:strand:- start:328 stop:576 length:249 start_codon:yes stop_codon:yes gene_type:complete
MEYGTCRVVCDAEVEEVYADIMVTEEERELNSDIIGATEAETKALIRRKLEVIAYKAYSEDCEYVDWVNREHKGVAPSLDLP